ncbi:MAG: hypothetical protein AAF743_09970 [Planctomycetota bacterium]
MREKTSPLERFDDRSLNGRMRPGANVVGKIYGTTNERLPQSGERGKLQNDPKVTARCWFANRVGDTHFVTTAPTDFKNNPALLRECRVSA